MLCAAPTVVVRFAVLVVSISAVRFVCSLLFIGSDLQPLGLFAFGTAGYLPTEEGSATFFEVLFVSFVVQAVYNSIRVGFRRRFVAKCDA
jgi:hypothetical protein